MGMPVVTVAAGGMAVTEVPNGMAVTEAANARGMAVTKVVGKFYGMAVTFVNADGGPVGLAFTAWNPSDLTAMTLSNNNLTAVSTATLGGVRGVRSLNSGKYYWECKLSPLTGNTGGAGIGLATAGLTSGIGNIGSAGVMRLSGIIKINNSSLTSAGDIPPGAIIGIASDFTAALIWFRVAPAGSWNYNGSANPSTGVGGLSIGPIAGNLFPIFLPTILGDGAIANFGASAFSGAVPSGFTAGWPA